MGLTLEKTTVLLQDNSEQYRLPRDFNFIKPLRIVSKDLSICFLALI